MNRELMEGKVYLEAQPEIKFEVEKKKGRGPATVM